MSRATAANRYPYIPLAIALCAIFTVPAIAAERVVLGEFFTATWCPACHSAGPYVENLIKDYPDTFAVVRYHIDDAYEAPGASPRALFYNVYNTGIPWFAYDGLWDAWPYTTYKSKFLQRQSVASPMTLEVGAELISGLTYEIQIRAHLEESASARTVRLHAVVVQDRYPVGETYYLDTYRANTGTNDVYLEPGDTYVEMRTLTFSSSWDIGAMGIVAWAQQPGSSYPAEVYQAAKDPYPFDALELLTPGDLNCDGVIDFGDINPFVAALSGQEPYEIAYPDCEWLNGDTNGDDTVDFDDINPFIALLSQ